MMSEVKDFQTLLLKQIDSARRDIARLIRGSRTREVQLTMIGTLTCLEQVKGLITDGKWPVAFQFVLDTKPSSIVIPKGARLE